MTGARVAAAVRWALALGFLGWSAWQLSVSWSSLQGSGLVFRPGLAAGAALAGALAMITMMGVSGVGVLVARLPNVTGRVFWLGWTRTWFQGFFFRYLPLKVVLVSERARLGARLGIPVAASVMLVVWESFLMLAGAGLLGGVGLLALPAAADQPVAGGAVVGLAVGALLGSLALSPVVGAVARRFPAFAARVPGIVLQVPAPWQVALVVGNGVAWALMGVSFALFCAATGPGAVPDAAVLGTWFVASYVGGALVSVSPGGIGVREGILVLGLSGAVTGPVALAWAVGHRAMLTLVEFALEAVATFLPLPERD